MTTHKHSHTRSTEQYTNKHDISPDTLNACSRADDQSPYRFERFLQVMGPAAGAKPCNILKVKLSMSVLIDKSVCPQGSEQRAAMQCVMSAPPTSLARQPARPPPPGPRPRPPPALITHMHGCLLSRCMRTDRLVDEDGHGRFSCQYVISNSLTISFRELLGPMFLKNLAFNIVFFSISFRNTSGRMFLKQDGANCF